MREIKLFQNTEYSFNIYLTRTHEIILIRPLDVLSFLVLYVNIGDFNYKKIFEIEPG